MSNAKVSIIIPTYNNQNTIPICIQSIEQQTYDNIEIIIVDGGSSDLTKEICRQYQVTLIETELGRSAARMKGSQWASGEFLFHVDSDMELTPFVVQECVQQSKIFDALIIPETNVGDSYWAQCTDVGKAVSRKKELGNLRFLPRYLYFKAGGHNPELVGKEDEELHDLVQSTGASISCLNSLIRHHVEDISILDIISQRWTYIRSLSAYDEHARIDSLQRSSEPRRLTVSILFEELKKRPRVVLGYLLLQVITATMAQINRAILLLTKTSFLH